MEDNVILFYTSLSFLLFFFITYKFYHSITPKSHKKSPPSPISIPILGHLYLVKRPVHVSLRKLSQKYGPVMSLKFGSRPVVVVSSPAAVEECFTKNDIVLANRPRLTMGKYLGYNYSTIASASYGDHWRNLRRIGAIEIFSGHRLNSFSGVRKDEVKRLLRKLSQNNSQHGFAKVDLTSMLSNLTFNNMMRMVAGKRYSGDDVGDEEEARKFRETMAGLFRYVGAANPDDFLPFLKWINGGRFEKKIIEVVKKVDKFLQGLIDMHRRNKENGVESNTMINHLLSLQESDPADYYTDEIIKGLVSVMLLAGTDTSLVTMEWAMSNLVSHPEILEKAKKEIDSQIGQENMMDEPDLPKLNYLQNIISETLRLYPVAPLLVPHFSSQDCNIGGYHVAADTMVLVNAWAIQTDPNIWDDPTSFRPERFEKCGQLGEVGYKLIPFGVGRRACPGSGMAQRVMGLTLGSLIQCFEWKSIGDGGVDLDVSVDNSGIRRAKPLEVMCRPRDIIKNML